MKLSKKQQEQIMKDNPMQGFDICSKCENVQLYGTMKDINEIRRTRRIFFGYWQN